MRERVVLVLGVQALYIRAERGLAAAAHPGT